MMMNPRTYGLGGAAIAGLMSCAELIRSLAVRSNLIGWSKLISGLGAAIFVSVLLMTAVGLALHKRFGWGFGVFGVLAGLGYGVMITAGGAGHTHAMWGGLYFAGGGALLYCLARSLPYYRADVAHA
jgi:hypothetical protein